MNINEKQDQIIQEFAPLNGWYETYERILKFESELPLFPDKYRTEENLLDGCQSRLWMAADLIDGKLVFHGDSDAKIMRGIIGLIFMVINGKKPEVIADTEFYFLEAIGLASNLSPSRTHGLHSIINRIKKLAIANKMEKP